MTTASTAPAVKEIWFLTGSQGMYGNDTLEQVAQQSRVIAEKLSAAPDLAAAIVWKPVLLDSRSIHRQILDANSAPACVGVIAWMHTFSPAKMWIAGLEALQKPLLHLHTQANLALPWSSIDMDFMNLNQAAHGDREFGFIQSRLRVARKTVAGHVDSPAVVDRITAWTRAALGRADLAALRVVRFGDNMREWRSPTATRSRLRAVTALRQHLQRERTGGRGRSVPEPDVDDLVTDTRTSSRGARSCSRRRASRITPRWSRIELGLRRFLRWRLRRLHPIFEDLGGCRQLPGLRSPAPDGRRLRLRWRGRLEDLVARAHPAR